MYLLASYLVFCYRRTNLLAVKSLFPSESILHAAVLPQTLIYLQDDFESAIGNGSFRDCEASPNKRCETESLATNFFNSKNKLQCNFQQLLALIFENLKRWLLFAKLKNSFLFVWSSRYFSMFVFSSFHFFQSFCFLLALLPTTFHDHFLLCLAGPLIHPVILPVISNKSSFKTFQ